MKFRRIVTTLLAALLVLTVIQIPESAQAAVLYRVGVDLTNQCVTVYRLSDGAIVRQMICSTGVSRMKTPTGTYYMPARRYSSERKLWYKMPDCWVKYASRITGGIMFHSYLYSAPNDSTVQYSSIQRLGTPASHGCVRLYVEDAKWIAQNCMTGTPVRIYYGSTRDDFLRTLLKEQTFVADEGITYDEYLCISDDAQVWGRGKTGTGVRQLQWRLIALGYLTGTPTGEYDVQTVIAVKEFQRASGITASGMANPQTRAALLANDAVVNTQTTLVEGSSGVAVENLQKDLAALKIYTGEIDGVFDAEVSDAVSRFQRIYHYTVTGQADADLQARVAERVAELEQQYGEDGYDVTFEQVVTEKARVVGIKTLYMLSEPSLDSQVLVGMPLGNELTVLERGDEWSKISYNGYEGYTLTCYMSIYSEEVEEAHYTARPEPDPTPEPVYTVQPELMARVRVQRGMLSLRKAPDEEATVVAKVADGTELKVLARGEEWTQLEYAGKSVYAQTENLRFFTRYNQVIDESSGATDSVEGAQTAGTTPEGTTPADQEPAGTTPADQEPTGTTPADQEPTGTTPADQEPAETTPADQEPAETTPADQEPTGTTPVDQGKDVVAQASPQSSEGVQAQSNGAAPTAQTQEGQNAPTAQTCEQGVSEPVAQQSPSAVPAEGT